MENEKNENLSAQAETNEIPYHTEQKPTERKKIIGSLADIIVGLLTFILTGELISSLAMSNNFSFTWKTTVIYFLFFITATAYIVTKKKEISLKAIPVGATALLLSLTFALHSNQGISTVIFLTIMILSGIYCIVLTKSGVYPLGSYFTLLDILKCEFLIPLGNIFTPYPAIARGIAAKKDKSEKKTDKKKVLPILLGIIVAVPVLLIVVPLLIDGDAAFSSVVGAVFKPFSEGFSKFFEELFDKIFNFDKVFYYFAAVFFSPYIFSVMFSFRHGINNEKNKDTSANYRALRKAPQSFFAAFLTVISVVYVIYLLSQTAYFFSAFTGHLPSGVKITVTEYAREGFFEMMKIAVINFCLIAFSVLFAKRTKGKITGIIKALDIFLCVFTIIISSTSLSKIILYMNRFGLTQKRIYVFVFDIVLIIAFLCVIVRFFTEKFPYMKVIISSVCIALTLLGFVGTDKFICDRNADLYLSGKLQNIDTEVMRNMSPSSVEALVAIAESDKPAAAQARIRLMDIRTGYAYYSYAAVLTQEGVIAKDASFDNLEEYKAVKALCDYFSDDNLANDSEHKAFIYYPDYFNSGEIMTLAVTTEKETSVVQNADGSPLDAQLYTFDIETAGVKHFTYTMTLKNGENVTIETKFNLVSIEHNWDEGDKDYYSFRQGPFRMVSTDEAWELISNGGL